MDGVIGDEKFLSTTEAAQESGYTQDYVGQLCRGKKIACKRVSGSWYVNRDSLFAYQREISGESPVEASDDEQQESDKNKYNIKVGNVRDDTFTHEGTEFISTSRASELTGYAQDYIGQLARNDEVKGRKIGRRWFVSRKALLEHKKHTDGMLAAVQAQAAGLNKEKEREEQDETSLGVHNTSAPIASPKQDIEPGNINFNVRYVSETDEHLAPKLRSTKQHPEDGNEYADGDIVQVPIRKTPPAPKNNIQPQRQFIPKRDIRDAELQAKKPISTPISTRSNAAHRKNEDVEDDVDNVPVYVPRTRSSSRARKNGYFTSVVILLFVVLCLAFVFVYLDRSGTTKVSAYTHKASVTLKIFMQSYADFVPGNSVEYSSEK